MNEANKDMTYCHGRGCALKNSCRRYLLGLRIKTTQGEVEERYWWMTACDEATRSGYLSEKDMRI